MANLYYLGHALEYEAGEVLNGHRAIVVINNLAYHADQSNPAHLSLVRGITVQSAIAGDNVIVQIGGPVQEPSWSWTPNLPIFVGINGQLTQTPPTTGWLLEIGVADTTTKIIVEPKIPFVRN
jgi:hypothetical protein